MLASEPAKEFCGQTPDLCRHYPVNSVIKLTLCILNPAKSTMFTTGVITNN